jgi:hypothetical protein
MKASPPGFLGRQRQLVWLEVRQSPRQKKLATLDSLQMQWARRNAVQGRCRLAERPAVAGLNIDRV